MIVHIIFRNTQVPLKLASGICPSTCPSISCFRQFWTLAKQIISAECQFCLSVLSVSSIMSPCFLKGKTLLGFCFCKSDLGQCEVLQAHLDSFFSKMQSKQAKWRDGYIVIRSPIRNHAHNRWNISIQGCWQIFRKLGHLPV